MTADRLERAVRAGWSGNTPIDSLGMFGMGFNIATARLGTVTTVWTSRAGEAEEHGLRIDFDELRRQGHFQTPRRSRPKTDPTRSGTSITIERVKPDQRAWFAKPGNRSNIKKELARAYSAMLRENGVPLNFKLVFNGRRVRAISHCVWNEDRSVETPRDGTVYSVQQIDRILPDRPFCTSCWQWLSPAESVCPNCDAGNNVVKRKRHVHGWIGLQRHLSSSDYGIDFIRNGRKIEIANRDLFYWRDPNTRRGELEYPIDDPRHRGRFVGEIHLDHSRVTYMKDRFDRTDPAWDEMVAIVRGQGPLQPQKASALGFTHNESALFRIYQAFRRSSPPKARVAGGWRNVLVVKDNDLAEEMAKRFHEGEASYQTDQKWWDLVEEEDNKLLTPASGGSGGGGATSGGAGLGGFTEVTQGGDSAGDASPASSKPPARTVISSLTREFRHDGTGLRWEVKAFEVGSDDPDLGGESRPWFLRRLPDGTTLFLVNPGHPIFCSATMTELDALLCELAYKAADFTRSQAGAPTFAEIVAGLRERYAGSLKLDSVALLNNAELLFRNIARVWCRTLEPDDGITLFNDLTTADREMIHHRMAARSIPNPQQVVCDGRFLEFASPGTVVEFILGHPDLFFDGQCWDDSYTDLDYGMPSVTEEARQRVLRHYEALLVDTVWLLEQGADDLDSAPRERVLRALFAVELLAPTPAEVVNSDG